jgi:cation transport ATPase
MRIDAAFRLALYGAFGLLFATGVIWLVADQLMDESGSDPWQQAGAYALMLHGGATIVTLTLLGALVPSHIRHVWREKRNRTIGIVSLTVCGLLIVTAFGLYYLGSEEVRPWVSFVHATVGLATPALLAAHILVGRGALSGPPMPAAALRRMPHALATLVPDDSATAAALSDANG